MNVEIERKFVVATPPDEAVLGSGVTMRQGYIAQDGDASVRIRITDRAAMLTVKVGGGLSRTEVEVAVTSEQAEALWQHTTGRRIHKTRYRVPLADSGRTAEVDLYRGDLSGLCTAEVEFESESAANSFDPPAWLGREVTGDVAWSNSALASDGRPPDRPNW